MNIIGLMVVLAVQGGSVTPPSVPPSETLADELRAVDDEFWRLLWQDCEPPEKLAAMIAPDQEMYHDRNGISHGRAGALRHLQRRCEALSQQGRKTRSVRVERTFRVDPVPGFGAVTSAERLFYFTDPGKPERAIGSSRVTIVWKKAGNLWQSYRLLSLDHREATK